MKSFYPSPITYHLSPITTFMSTPEQPIPQMPSPAVNPTPVPDFAEVLKRMLAVSDKVSDLIFSPGRPPQVELIGKLQPVHIPGLEKLTPAHTAGISKLIIGSHVRAGHNMAASQNLEQHGSADLSFSAPGLSRFRVNIFMQRGTHAIVMRVVPPRVQPCARLRKSFSSARCATARRLKSRWKRRKQDTLSFQPCTRLMLRKRLTASSASFPKTRSTSSERASHSLSATSFRSVCFRAP